MKVPLKQLHHSHGQFQPQQTLTKSPNFALTDKVITTLQYHINAQMQPSTQPTGTVSDKLAAYIRNFSHKITMPYSNYTPKIVPQLCKPSPNSVAPVANAE